MCCEKQINRQLLVILIGVYSFFTPAIDEAVQNIVTELSKYQLYMQKEGYVIVGYMRKSPEKHPKYTKHNDVA